MRIIPPLLIFMNTNGPLISIVIPTLNRADRISNAIESCLLQTHSNIEVIVVNDGSTDNTIEVVEGWTKKDARVHLVNHETNQTIPNALNSGFAISQGDYLTWIADDNRYHPRAVERMLDALLKDSTADMVYCDFEAHEINPEGEDRKWVIEVGQPEDLIASNIVGACFLYKSTIRQSVGDYATDRYLVEDTEYWLRVAMQCKMIPLHEVHFTHTIWSGALNCAQRVPHLKAVYRCILDYVKVWPYYSKRKKAALLRNLCSQARSHGIKDYDKEFLLKCFHISPTISLVQTTITMSKAIASGLKKFRRKIIRFQLRKSKRTLRIFGINIIKQKKV